MRGPEEAEAFLLHLALALQAEEGNKQIHSTALHRLIRGLKTNAQRKLLAQQFAMTVMEVR